MAASVPVAEDDEPCDEEEPPEEDEPLEDEEPLEDDELLVEEELVDDEEPLVLSFGGVEDSSEGWLALRSFGWLASPTRWTPLRPELEARETSDGSNDPVLVPVEAVVVELCGAAGAAG